MAAQDPGLAFDGGLERLVQLAALAMQNTKLKAAQTACEMLARDLLLLVMGVRNAVLVDYLPPALVPGKLQDCVRNFAMADEEFGVLHVCCLSEGNYLMINLPFFAARLRSSVEHRLADIELVDCSSRLSDPTHLGTEAKDMLLPCFNIVCQSIDGFMTKLDPSNPSLRPKQMLNLKGDSCGAPLPTLAGWVLEYPIVYFVDDPLSGNCLPEQELLLFRFELPHPNPPPSSAHPAPDAASSVPAEPAGEQEGAAEIGVMMGAHHVLSFTVPEELYGEAGKRAVEGLKKRIAARVGWGGGGGSGGSGEEEEKPGGEQGGAGEAGRVQRRKREREEGGSEPGRWRVWFSPRVVTRSISCHVVAL